MGVLSLLICYIAYGLLILSMVGISLALLRPNFGASLFYLFLAVVLGFLLL